ncbi:MAG: Sua5/YciO/YrdC/YwlC family protein [Thermoleophilaceae bacterium]
MTAGDPRTGAATRRLDASAAAAFESCVAHGGVAVFPADTVYGLATDPESPEGFERLYALKRRRPDMPSAAMLFSLAAALDALPELGPRTRAVFERLLPGPLTLVVPNPRRRFPLACGPTPERLGVRVPALDGPLKPLRAVARPVVQSSANHHGGPDPRRLGDVPEEIRAGADLVLDGGELPGTASTVVDLGGYEDDGRYEILREGAMPAAELARRL